jgi:hypothetical protein
LRQTGIVTPSASLTLIALGAILIWGVTYEAEGVDLDAIGVILIVVGLVGAVVWLTLWDHWATVRYPGGPPRRTTVVEEDVEGSPPTLLPPR